ncbi:MAG: ketopantoate reductase family protein [Burkholderiales bacterium]
MKVCVYGAGAVGGHFAAQLAATGNDVAVIARGDHLSAIRRNGLVLVKGERRILGKVRASDRPAEIGPVDVVLVTLKTTSLGALAAGIGSLLGPETLVVFAQNGIPWWYAQGLAGGRIAPPELAQLDPGSALARAVPASSVAGAVIYSASEVVEPGVVRNDAPQRNMLVLGLPRGQTDARLQAFSAALEAGEIRAPIETDIRRSVWAKVLINLGGSAISLITGETLRDTFADPALAELRKRVQAEGAAVALASGVTLEGAPQPTAHVPGGPAHKTSMLQDYELGRPLELDSLLRAPLWFARAAAVPTPALDAVLSLALHKAIK